MQIKYILYLLFLIFFINVVYSKPKGSLKGEVFDRETENPIIGATIRIEGTTLGSYTNKEGKFYIKAIPIGKYKLLISAVGYETYKTEIKIIENKDTNIVIKLKSKVLIANEIVITANKKIQTVQEVPISLSIIKGNIFSDKSISTIDEALKYIPSIEVNNDNISIRGSSGFAFGIGSRAIMLIDGFPVLSGDNGDIKSDVIPFPLIEQIEVIKGAGSALYGASALGGVINLVTRDAKDRAYVTINSHIGIYTKPKYKTWQFSDRLQRESGVNFGYLQRFGRFGVGMAGSYVKDDGYRFYNKEERSMLYFKSSYSLTDFTNISLNSQYSQSYRDDWVYWQSLDYATQPPANTDLDNQILTKKYFVGIELKHIISANNFITFKNSIFRTDLKNQLKGEEFRQSEASTYNTEFQLNSKISEFLNLTSGLSYSYNQVKAKIYGNQFQNNVSFYSQFENILGDLVLTYGGRFDAEQTEGIQSDLTKSKIEFSPKAGLAYKTVYNSTVRLSVGKGFRPASIAERFASVSFQGFSVVPNPKLKNEKSISMEVGYNLPGKIEEIPVILDVSLYNNELYNLIEPKFITSTTPEIQFINTTRARVTGLEFDFKALLSNNFGSEIAFNMMNPIDLNENKKLKYRSVFSSLIKLYYNYYNFTFTADYRYKSKAERIDNELRLQIKNYDARVAVHLLDFGIKYNYKNFDFSLSSFNALDYYYTEVPGNLGKTRQIVFSIGYNIK